MRESPPSSKAMVGPQEIIPSVFDHSSSLKHTSFPGLFDARLNLLGYGSVQPSHLASERIVQILWWILVDSEFAEKCILEAARRCGPDEVVDEAPGFHPDLEEEDLALLAEHEQDVQADAGQEEDGSINPLLEDPLGTSITRLLSALVNGYGSRTRFEGLPPLTLAVVRSYLETVRRWAPFRFNPDIIIDINALIGCRLWESNRFYLSPYETTSCAHSMAEDLWNIADHEILLYTGLARTFFSSFAVSFAKRIEHNRKAHVDVKAQNIKDGLTSGRSVMPLAMMNIYLWIHATDYRRWTTRSLMLSRMQQGANRSHSVLCVQLHGLLACWTDTWSKVLSSRSLASLIHLRMYIHASLTAGLRLMDDTYRLDCAMEPASLTAAKIIYVRPLIHLVENQTIASSMGVGWLELLISLYMTIRGLWKQYTHQYLQAAPNESVSYLKQRSRERTGSHRPIKRGATVCDVPLDSLDVDIVKASKCMDRLNQQRQDALPETDIFFLRSKPKDKQPNTPYVDEPGAMDYIQLWGLHDPHLYEDVDILGLCFLLSLPTIHETVCGTPESGIIPQGMKEISKGQKPVVDRNRGKAVIDRRYLVQPEGREGNPPNGVLKGLRRMRLLDMSEEGHVGDPSVGWFKESDWLPPGFVCSPLITQSSPLACTLPPEPKNAISSDHGGCRPLTSLLCHYVVRIGGDPSALRWALHYGGMGSDIPLHHQLMVLRMAIEGGPSLEDAWIEMAATLLSQAHSTGIGEAVYWAFPIDIRPGWWMDFAAPDCGFVMRSIAGLAALLIIIGCILKDPVICERILSGVIVRHYFLVKDLKTIKNTDIETAWRQEGLAECPGIANRRRVAQLWLRCGSHPDIVPVKDDSAYNLGIFTRPKIDRLFTKIMALA